MFIFTILFGFIITSVQSSDTGKWQTLSSGMEIKFLDAKKTNSEGDSKITIVRIDPKLWELVFAGISLTNGESVKTAKEWCESKNFVAAINAGMFATDYRTHTGYLRFRDHVNSSHINNYQSVMAFDPVKGKGLSPYRIFDLDAPGISIQTIQNDYRAVIQNLRLLKKPGINVWKQQDRKWSEAAIGEDKEGRILFIFTRHPFTMHDLNEVLLKSGIGIVAAQHLEGGPEAQLYIKIGDFELELCGSYETSYNEDDKNTNFWPIPNIIGVRQSLLKGK